MSLKEGGAILSNANFDPCPDIWRPKTILNEGGE